ncbi:tetratricopeptide repeat protein [Vibrio parahaemolyticus]|uniref:tetratricopeptide repeat protein n=1 Tax=Vibrio parahaemolyticus TaxID=670 RepID=UPI002360C7DC|nr:tetratricopeptide repeat protein [Vibrio parahaemolyticus]
MTTLQQVLVKVKQALISAPELLNDEDIDTADLTYQQGVQAFKERDYEGALTCFTAAVIQLPFNATYSFALGMTYHALHEEREAIGFYVRAWVLDASNPSSCFRLGQCYFALNDYSDAIEATKAAIQLSKNEPRYKLIFTLSNQLLDKIVQKQQQHCR